MPVLPKSLFTLGASLQTARMMRRLRETHSAVPAQRKAFSSLAYKCATTAYGRKFGVEQGKPYETFRRRVPLSTYEQLVPYIDRMKHGEADVLWPGRCSFFADTSGTTTGKPKSVPITGEMLAHFNRAGRHSVLYYTARAGRADVFRGRHLFIGASTALQPIPDVAPFVAFSGDLSGITFLNLPASAERHLFEPGAEIAQLADWTKKLDAIVRRTPSLDISLVAGLPNWLLTLAEALRAGTPEGRAAGFTLRSLWPNLECIVHGGAPLAPVQEALRALGGDGVAFHEVYPACEGFIAAQDATPGEGLRLLADSGLFFEFLPMAEFEPTRLASLGPKAVPLEDVATGVDYALVLTTPAGLCRYVLGDVVRFISTTPPRLVYVGRTKLQLNAFGERVMEKEVTDSLVRMCREQGWTLTNFHVAPLFTASLTGQTRGRHEWWIELQPGSVRTPIGASIAVDLDAQLCTRNPDYAARRKAGTLELPFVRLVMPGVFEHWMRHNEKWGGQNKVPRCRSDRAVADGLTKVARFTED
ncbi:MAG: GH3 auxin-responsive promoter family protein [Verrucomicrobia bacterium]|nr:GH3 auxin-responsive promoter family protein [Verrucomicrobiota bacterium]